MWGELETQGEGVRRKNSEEWNCIHNHTDSISWSAHPRKPACHLPPLSPGWYLDATLFPDGQPQHPGPAAPLSHCSLSSVQPWEGFCSCSGHRLTQPPPQAEPGLRVGCREDQGLQEGDGEVTQGENWSRGRGIAERATLPGLILVRIMEQLHHSSG